VDEQTSRRRSSRDQHALGSLPGSHRWARRSKRSWTRRGDQEEAEEEEEEEEGGGEDEEKADEEGGEEEAAAVAVPLLLMESVSRLHLVRSYRVG